MTIILLTTLYQNGVGTEMLQIKYCAAFTHKKLTLTSPIIVPFWGSSQSGKYFSQILCGRFVRVVVGFGLLSNCMVTTQGEADHPCVSDQTECNRSPKPTVIPELCTFTTITRKLFSAL